MAIKQVAEIAEDSFIKIGKYQKGEIEPVKTGRPWLDKVFGGLLPGDKIAIAGSSGCVDKHTEYFNGEEWKSIADYTEGEEVLQYNEDGTAEMVVPTNYIKKLSTGFYLIKSKYGVNQCVSEEHKMVYVSDKGHLNTKSAKDTVEMHNRAKTGFSGRFYTTFNFSPKNEVELDENYLRLAICIQADGHYTSPNYFNEDKGGYHINIRIKKEPKKKRLEYLLDLNNIEYRKKDISHQKASKGFHKYSFYFKDFVKSFPKEWFKLSLRCRQIFWDEFKHWDSSTAGKRLPAYYSNDKGNADLIQFIASSLGYRSTVKEDDHRENINYVVRSTTRTICGITSNTKKDIALTPPVEGEYKYCFTVPSGMLVLRRGGNINITGNSGKSFELQRVKNYVMDTDNNPNANNFVWLDHSLEMRMMSNIIRDINLKTKKSKGKILSEEFTEEEYEIVTKYYNEISDGRFFVEEDPSDSTTFYKNMKDFLSEHTDKEAVFVSIDHIALAKAESGRKKNAVDDTMEMINRLSKEFPNSYWIILSQLNREIERRSKDKDYDSKPNRGDLYASDTIFHLADYVYVTHNPYKLGINSFMRFNENRYDMLEEHFTDRKNGKASFDSLGRVFFIVLKMREAGSVFQDVYIDELDIPDIEKYRDSRENSGTISSSGPPKFGDQQKEVPVFDQTKDPTSKPGSLNGQAGKNPF
jgi:replicative DNA helicase